jgi:hypothetical protein
MLYAKGISWIDDCRIPFVDGDTTSAGKRTCNIFETEYKSGGNGSPDYFTDQRGRFPANILVSDDMLNDGNITSQNTGVRKNPGIKTKEWEAGYKKIEIKTQGDKGTNSRYYDIDKWFDNLLEL